MSIKPLIKVGIEKIRLLPGEMRKKIRPLLENPGLGFETIGEISFNEESVQIHSNCLGTLAHCYNIDYEPLNISCGHGDPVCFPVEGRPGYLDGLVFEDILSENFFGIEAPSPGDIVLVRYQTRIPSDFYDSNIRHGVIHVEDLGTKFHRIFYQGRSGENFRLARSKLKPSGKDTFIEFYRRK